MPSPPAFTSWYLDSGALFHVTNDPKNLQKLTPFEVHDQTFIGNRQGFHIHSIGSNTFTSPIHSHTPLTL